MKHLLVVFFGLSCFSLTVPARAFPALPEVLKPWVGWVLEGSERCARLYDDEESKCVWPSRLYLSLKQNGGVFEQEWRLYRKAMVALPGDHRFWPREVRVNGKDGYVVTHNNAPFLVLEKGDHKVKGVFSWNAIPRKLAIPTNTGLINLELNGKKINFPLRDKGGALLVGKEKQIKGERSRLDVVVHRKIIDEIPLKIQTRIKLDVAGKSREIFLDRSILEGFIPLQMKSQLPARLEDNGVLRVQVRPGTFFIRVDSRQGQKKDSLKLNKGKAPWPKSEVWVFEPRPELRLVELSGLQAIDSQQTTIPNEWRRFSAYQIKEESELKFVQRRRGAAKSSVNQMTLSRHLWLDFDGKGMTFKDRLKGSLKENLRIEMGQYANLGRISLKNEDQFITKHDGRVGIEVQRGPFDISGEGRIKENSSSFNAISWNHDVQQLKATLNLPPGWMLFHASGADHATHTWINRWSLLDMFMVLLISLAIAKLYSWKVGVLAFAALTLSFIEPDAPRWIWPFVIVFEALRRVLPSSWFQKTVTGVYLFLVVILLLIILPFSLFEIRKAIYPNLEYPNKNIIGAGYTPGYTSEGSFLLGDMKAAAPSSTLNQSLISDKEAKPQKKEYRRRSKYRSKSGRSLYDYQNQNEQIQLRKDNEALQNLVDPNAIVQTGPGLPLWGWNRLSLSWDGPVQKDEKLRLYLVSPTVNFFIGILRAFFLLGLLVFMLMIGKSKRDWFGASSKHSITMTVLILLGMSFLGQKAYADYPNEKMLSELKTRLLKPELCHPRCASSSELKLDIKKESLSGKIFVDAAAEIAIPLPGRYKQWSPHDVYVDGKAAKALVWFENSLWVALKKGRHQIQFSGPLPRASTVSLSLAFSYRNVRATSEGWRVDGIREDGTAEATLTLTRSMLEGKAVKALQPGELPAFLLVKRRIVLGLSWSIQTEVKRLTPLGSPFALSIPLIEGESVISEGLRVKDGNIHLQFAPNQSIASWRSVLKRKAQLMLLASDSSRFVEEWQLMSSPLWHVEMRGLPQIHQTSSSNSVPTFRPWAKEKLVLRISRPKGIGGQSLTIDRSILTITPGNRISEVLLTLSMRSSRGGEQQIRLPYGAKVYELKLGSKSQPVRQEKDRLSLQLSPGETEVAIKWRQNKGIGFYYKTPKILLNSRSVNATVKIKVQRNRWLLLTGGADVGPVVLYWSLLAFIIVIAFLLPRLVSTPLNVIHWFLLCIGLSQVSIWTTPFVIGWLAFMRWRDVSTNWGGVVLFNLRQVVIGLALIPALIVIIIAIQKGLLGYPNMEVVGNQSWSRSLSFFNDRLSDALPQPWVISLPLWVYRVFMLLWALWLAWMFVGWSKWSWNAFRNGGLWKKSPPKAPMPIQNQQNMAMMQSPFMTPPSQPIAPVAHHRGDEEQACVENEKNLQKSQSVEVKNESNEDDE